MVQYYFVAYTEEDLRSTITRNEVIDEHPIEYMMRISREHETKRFTLIFYADIPNDVADKYLDAYE